MIAVLSDYNDIDTIKSSLIDHKIIGFKEVYLDINQQREIVEKLLTDDELVTNKGEHTDTAGFHLAIKENVEKIVNEEILNMHDPIGFMHGNWHQDNTDEKYIPSYVSMSMTKYLCSEKGIGETVFIDLEKAFLDCPEDIKYYLDGIDVRHVSPNTQPDGYIASPYRINPETGNICLYYSNDDMTPVDGMTTEFQSYLDWFRAYRESNFTEGDVYLTWEWDEGDFIIWDNRNIIHSVTGGWKIGDRIFNKINAKMEKAINGRRQG